MAGYKAPLRDIHFVLDELLGVDCLKELPGYEHVTPEVVQMVLGQGAEVCQEVLDPLNRIGDEEGCHYADGVVSTPAGFKAAYDKIVDGGWPSLACEPDHGGQGLPELINLVFGEFMCSSNLSFATYLALSYCAYKGVLEHASEAIKATYLPPLAEGRWSGTMCLTEPQCGTDLGLIRTKGVPEKDGTFKVTGTKLFISAGEHDLTENILHLVLARLPNSPPGTKGLSLLLVPKVLVNPDGRLGDRNAVRCSGIEQKMGLHASATCVLNFDGATGYLIGEENNGLRCMFTVMNVARLAVGLQGVGLAETAYQRAREYARERLQGRALGEERCPDQPADPIIVHPDVRNMLMTMRALAEGGRALTYWVGFNLDVAKRHADPEICREADELAQLMTPVIKAFLTDCGVEATNLGMQVYGGHGYIREQGMEQLVRDARIGPVYEGTNAIQALDLVGRKLPVHYGRLLRQLFHPLDRFIEEHKGNDSLQDFVKPLAKAFSRLQQATLWLAEQGLKDPVEGAAAARDYANLLALVAMAFMWAKSAKIARANLNAGEDLMFYRAKIATARFFFDRLLPRTLTHFVAMMAGSGSVMELEPEAF